MNHRFSEEIHLVSIIMDFIRFSPWACLFFILPLCTACVSTRVSGIVNVNSLAMPNLQAHLPSEEEIGEDLKRFDVIERLPTTNDINAPGGYDEQYGKLWATPQTLPYRVASLRKEAYRTMMTQEEFDKKLEVIAQEIEKELCFTLVARDFTNDSNVANTKYWHAWFQQNDSQESVKGAFTFSTPGERTTRTSTRTSRYGSYTSQSSEIWWAAFLCFPGHAKLAEGFMMRIESRYKDNIRPIVFRWDVQQKSEDE